MSETLGLQHAARAVPAPDADREAFRSFLSRLYWTAGSFEVLPVMPKRSEREVFGPREPGRPVRPGFLVHSLLGLGLRAVACPLQPRCDGACRRAKECAYGQLLQPQPAQSGLPLSGVERAPVPVAIDAPWKFYEPGAPLRFRVILLGDASLLRDTVTEALIEGFIGGVGPGSSLVSVVPRGWRDGRFGAVETDSTAEPVGRRLRILMVSPLRLVRNKKELATFDLESVVRDLGFRLAVWGHYHEGLEWPAPWRFLQDDAHAVRVTASDVRQVSFHRYSGRQDRVIPMKGLMGTVDLSGVSPDLALLLRAGELCGVGKGASIGLGRIRITDI